MTADTELLPLPPRVVVDKHLPTGVVIYGYTHDMMRDYARANVAHATAPLQAEIEALRELCGMAYQLAGVHDAPEKWLDALSNAAAGRPFSTDGLLPYMPQAVCAAEARADKLAEALEEIRSRSSIDLAMNPNPFELTAMLGDIHQIACAALAQEDDQ